MNNRAVKSNSLCNSSLILVCKGNAHTVMNPYTGMVSNISIIFIIIIVVFCQ